MAKGPGVRIWKAVKDRLGGDRGVFRFAIIEDGRGREQYREERNFCKVEFMGRVLRRVMSYVGFQRGCERFSGSVRELKICEKVSGSI